MLTISACHVQSVQTWGAISLKQTEEKRVGSLLFGRRSKLKIHNHFRAHSSVSNDMRSDASQKKCISTGSSGMQG